MTSANRQVELLEKNKPRQERAKRTYERILVAAAELLIEVGVERISTNIMAERAGITVPALYRYFPNKYAVLHAMGATMMDRQNDVVLEWFEKNVDVREPAVLLQSIELLLRATYEITNSQLAGLEIIQSLRAVGPLQEVRLTSNRLVAEQFAVVLGEMFDWQVNEALVMQARLSVEMGYAVVELALEDSTLSTDDTLTQGAKMIQAYWEEVLKQRASA
ncbi:MAG: helix-turn-helix domain-containing protein [Halioglobus sp.]